MREIFEKILSEIKRKIHNYCPSIDHYCVSEKVVKIGDTEQAVKEVADEYNNGWIPVSERLPEVCGLGVLLTIENKFQQRKAIQGFTGYMERGKLEFHTNDKCTNLEVWRVIAWQPLPSPYKPKEDCA